jgi:hypothetical protein
MKKMEDNFQNTFNQLKSILKKFENNLRVKADNDNNYCLNAGYDEKRKADIYFGAVQIKKNYVSYHLMPVYVNPKLLDGISPEIKKRMQGKSCFNFKEIDKAMLSELSDLTKKGFEFYKTSGML